MFHVEHMESLEDFTSSNALQLDLHLSEHHLSQILQYLRELLIWNRTVNLTGTTDPKQIIVKHILDSLVGTKAFESNQKVTLLDVGSGAGFPGIPLKIVRPDIELRLLEPNYKKAAFLRHIIGLFQLENASVEHDTLESFVANVTRSFSHVTIRAFRSERFLAKISKLLNSCGRLLLYRAKTQVLDDRLTREAGLAIKDKISYSLPGGLGERVLIILSPFTVPRGTVDHLR